MKHRAYDDSSSHLVTRKAWCNAILCLLKVNFRDLINLRVHEGATYTKRVNEIPCIQAMHSPLSRRDVCSTTSTV